MKNVKVLISVATLVVCSAATAFGDVTDTKNLTINATVSAMAKLSLDAAAVSFANADPDAVPSIASSPASVSITAKAKSGSASTVTLTVQSDDDLKSGSDTIAIGNVTWSSATGAGWSANGTMNKTVPQTVASWTGSGSRVGTNSYFLANSWNYATGTYSATTTYTLTSP